MKGKNLTPAEPELSDSGKEAKGAVADGIVRSLHPARVFDTGGKLIESLRDRGVEARGPARSILEPFEGRFDLVTCLDGLDHRPEQEVRLAVQQISQATDVVLLSSASWRQLFAEHGFEPDVSFDASYAGSNAILLRRRAGGAVDRIAQLEAEAAFERRRAARLASTVSELKGRLEAIEESPGWRLVSGYRNWLRAARTRHRLVSRWLEPLAARMLRSLA